jgi:hypothetical protein
MHGFRKSPVSDVARPIGRPCDDLELNALLLARRNGFQKAMREHVAYLLLLNWSTILFASSCGVNDTPCLGIISSQL